MFVELKLGLRKVKELNPHVYYHGLFSRQFDAPMSDLPCGRRCTRNTFLAEPFA